MNTPFGNISEGFPGTAWLTTTVTFELYNHEREEKKKGKLLVGKKMTSIRVCEVPKRCHNDLNIL